MWGAAGSVGTIFVEAAHMLHSLQSFVWTGRDAGCGMSSVSIIGLEWFEPLKVVYERPERAGSSCTLITHKKQEVVRDTTGRVERIIGGFMGGSRGRR